MGNVEHCVCCGREIPEGRQYCVICGKVTAEKKDLVEVVRCKDCKHFTPKEKLNPIKYINPLEADGLCENSDKYIDSDDYCSYGVRKGAE